MREEFLQYIWANSLYRSDKCVTCSGKELSIINVGQSNKDSGPDFFNARICIGGIELAGNVEVHLRNSDWYRHGHYQNEAYNNVILSVVKEADVRIYNVLGEEIETIVLDYTEVLYDEYMFMKSAFQRPGCRRNLASLEHVWFYWLLQRMAIERLERKCADIERMLEQTQNDWEECFYRLLCKYWGGNVNAEPFYQLALHIPYRILLRYSDKPLALEALLSGTSGLLEKADDDQYVAALKKEYHYLRIKHQLAAVNPSQWKFMRVRPDAFPTVRLALLASFLQKFSNLVSRILDAVSLKEVFGLLEVTASAYWDNHYLFGRESAPKAKRMGEEIKNVIIINSVIPFMFLYGKKRNEAKYTDKVLEWLELLGPEHNYITKEWESAGFVLHSALQTQAVIQLRKEYCDRHLCLKCAIGRKTLADLKSKGSINDNTHNGQ